MRNALRFGSAGCLAILLLGAPAFGTENDVVVYPGSTPALWMNAGQYHHLTEELGLMVASKVLNPSNTLGINGFDMGAEVDTALIHGSEAYWQKATPGGNVPSVYPLPTLRVRKGLPFSFEGGMSLTFIPATQQEVLGGMGRFALHEGYALVPNVAVQVSYDDYIGNPQLNMNVEQAVATMGYTWPFGRDSDLKTGRFSAWVGYGKGEIDSNVSLTGIGLSSSAAQGFFNEIGTDPSGHLLINYAKWVGGIEVESGHFAFTLDGELVDGGIPTINARWGTLF
jgi:hypothetical protein